VSANTQGLLNKFSAVIACLCGIAGVHSYDLMTSSCSLLFKDSQERAPTGVQNGFRQMVIFHHIRDLKVFNGNTLIAFGIGLSDFEMMVAALPIDLQVRLGNVARCLAETFAPLLASRELTLLASKRLLRGTIEARILDSLALAIGEEGRETDINTDVRMLTREKGKFGLWLCLTDDEGIPMPVSTQDEMNGFGSSEKGAMQLDLEAVTEFLGDHEVLPILMQIDIFAILPQLNGVPAIGLLEAGEAAFLTKFLGGKKAFQGFCQAISKHLNRGGWHMLFALSLELCFQLVLIGKGATFLVFLPGYGSHLIIDPTSLSQSRHELAMLLLIHKKAVLKGSHGDILHSVIRVIKGQAQPPALNKEGPLHPQV